MITIPGTHRLGLAVRWRLVVCLWLILFSSVPTGWAQPAASGSVTGTVANAVTGQILHETYRSNKPGAPTVINSTSQRDTRLASTNFPSGCR